MEKKFENITELNTRQEYDEALAYTKSLIVEATQKGFLSAPDIDNEYVREIGRIGNICADYEDTKMQFNHITVRGRPPLVSVQQGEMYKRDIKHKLILEYA